MIMNGILESYWNSLTPQVSTKHWRGTPELSPLDGKMMTFRTLTRRRSLNDDMAGSTTTAATEQQQGNLLAPVTGDAGDTPNMNAPMVDGG